MPVGVPCFASASGNKTSAAVLILLCVKTQAFSHPAAAQLAELIMCFEIGRPVSCELVVIRRSARFLPGMTNDIVRCRGVWCKLVQQFC